MTLHRESRRGRVIVARIRHIATTATATATAQAFALLQTSFGFFMQKQFAGNVRFATRQRVPIHSAHRATIQHPFSNSFCVFTVFISASFSLLCAWDLRWKLAWGELNCAHAAFFRFSAYSPRPFSLLFLSLPSLYCLITAKLRCLFIHRCLVATVNIILSMACAMLWSSLFPCSGGGVSEREEGVRYFVWCSSNSNSRLICYFITLRILTHLLKMHL